MFPEDGQTKKYCFLAMFPEGGQTRKYCLQARCPEDGLTRKHCFLAIFRKDGQIRKHCFSAIFSSQGGQTRKHCFLLGHSIDQDFNACTMDMHLIVQHLKLYGKGLHVPPPSRLLHFQSHYFYF